MLNPGEANEVLSQFPDVTFAFAYGSGAVTQDGYDYSKKAAADLPMLDLILVVDDPFQWHTENMQRNPHHYSPLFPLSSRGITYVQEHFQAHFWFNPYVPAAIASQPGRLMKYGVISTSQALEDLHTWNNLYLAGRLHKPVHILKDHPVFSAAMSRNRLSALQTACLLLPQKFSEVDLFLTIASLSYVGDPRMMIGENPKKVENLVLPVVPLYQALYAKEIQMLLAEPPAAIAADPAAAVLPAAATSASPSSSAAAATVGREDAAAPRWKGLSARLGRLRERSLWAKRPDGAAPEAYHHPLLYHHVPAHPFLHPAHQASEAHTPYQGIYVQDASTRGRWKRATQLPARLKFLLAIRYRPVSHRRTRLSPSSLTLVIA